MIEESLLKSNYIGKDGFTWWVGQVAKKSSWEKGSTYANKEDWAARCKVRIVGYHPFNGNILKDEDLPWAQIMLDPAYGSAQGGLGGTAALTGGETCIGFFLDGDDGQQPVIIGLLHRNKNVKNLIPDDLVEKEKSSQFKPFSGNPNPTTTQRPSLRTRTEGQPTQPIPSDPFSIGYNFNATSGTTDSKGNPVINPFSDRLAGLTCESPAASTVAIMREFCNRPDFIKHNGCENNLISQITLALQNFIAITKGLDNYISTYVDPVLNEIVDIASTIKDCARQIGKIIRLIISNLRNTIIKCIFWAIRKFFAAIGIPDSQQKVIIEAIKKILDKIFCILEKLPGNLVSFVENLLGNLLANTINAPVCALEQWTAGVLQKVMDSIEDALSVIMSGISWLTGGLSTISGILNEASSLASQIFNFLECTGLACKKPSAWALKFGPTEKDADNWEKMVDKVNIFKGISKDLGSVEKALEVTPVYAGINGRFNDIFNECNEKVINPTDQNDIIPSSDGMKYKTCIPPIVKIIGDCIISAKAVPIVNTDGSIFSVEVINGGLGYTTPPTIRIIDNTGHGNNAFAKSIIENGSVKAIYLTSTGYGYCAKNYELDEMISISSSKKSIFEGESFDINLNSRNISDDTEIRYEITGISERSIKQSLIGNVIIKNNRASITINTNKGIIEDTKLLRFTLVDYQKSVEVMVQKNPIQQTAKKQYYLDSSKKEITEGQSFLINLTTKNVDDDTLVPYTITGISQGLLKNSSLSGNFKVKNNKSTIEFKTLEKTILKSQIFKITVNDGLASAYVLIQPILDPTIKPIPGPNDKVVGCVQDLVVLTPGYGYLASDTISDGKNTYKPIVIPEIGSIIGIEPLKTPICGFSEVPTLTINTRTGVAANLVPIMKYVPTSDRINQQTLTSGITTSVIDCI